MMKGLLPGSLQKQLTVSFLEMLALSLSKCRREYHILFPSTSSGSTRRYTRHGHKLNFSHETGGQEKDFAHPTKAHPKKV